MSTLRIAQQRIQKRAQLHASALIGAALPTLSLTENLARLFALRERLHAEGIATGLITLQMRRMHDFEVVTSPSLRDRFVGTHQVVLFACFDKATGDELEQLQATLLPLCKDYEQAGFALIPAGATHYFWVDGTGTRALIEAPIFEEKALAHAQDEQQAAFEDYHRYEELLGLMAKHHYLLIEGAAIGTDELTWSQIKRRMPIIEIDTPQGKAQLIRDPAFVSQSTAEPTAEPAAEPTAEPAAKPSAESAAKAASGTVNQTAAQAELDALLAHFQLKATPLDKQLPEIVGFGIRFDELPLFSPLIVNEHPPKDTF